jgi:phosphoribosyl 1,2-cyclic phosphodiesterase
MNSSFQTSVLASGSKGNCFFVRNGDTQILIDAGITHKYYFNALTNLNINPNKLDAIFLSHLHSDHISGSGVISRKTGCPIYVSSKNRLYFLAKKLIHEDSQNLLTFKNGENIIINNILIQPFSSSHDSLDSCNFMIKKDDNSTQNLIIVTDTGYATNQLKHKLKSATTIIIESNHDVKMLRNGPYDWHLQQRILSRTGHLSNEQCSLLIEEILNENHKQIVLAHLSEINNTPTLARNQMENTLKKLNFKINLYISSQNQETKLIDI